MAILLALEFWVEISGTISAVYHVVAGPLVHIRESECAANAIFVVYIGGGRPVSTKRRRATPKETRAFDSTMGFPGEDVAVQYQC